MIDFWFRIAVVVIVIAVTYWFVETYPVTAALFGLAAFGLIFLISANMCAARHRNICTLIGHFD
jgi:hypothetical protein